MNKVDKTKETKTQQEEKDKLLMELGIAGQMQALTLLATGRASSYSDELWDKSSKAIDYYLDAR